MKASFFSIFSITLCFLAALVAASPVSNAVALETRDVRADVIATLSIAQIAIDDCNRHYRTLCGPVSCPQRLLDEWALEIKVIVDLCIVDIKVYIGVELPSLVDITHYTGLVIVLVASIKSTALHFVTYCGLLNGLLGTVFGLLASIFAVGGSCFAVTGALNDLIICLGIHISL